MRGYCRRRGKLTHDYGGLHGKASRGWGGLRGRYHKVHGAGVAEDSVPALIRASIRP